MALITRLNTNGNLTVTKAEDNLEGTLAHYGDLYQAYLFMDDSFEAAVSSGDTSTANNLFLARTAAAVALSDLINNSDCYLAMPDGVPMVSDRSRETVKTTVTTIISTIDELMSNETLSFTLLPLDVLRTIVSEWTK